MSRDTSDGRREAVLQFNTFPQTPQEFLAANLKSALDPESLFVRQLLVNLRTEDGALSITDDELTIRRGGKTPQHTSRKTRVVSSLVTRFFIVITT